MAWILLNKGDRTNGSFKTKAQAEKARDKAVERSSKFKIFEKQKKTDYKIIKTEKQ